MKTICYISHSVEHKSQEKLKTLYNKAKINNSKQGITGILIYKNQTFLQVLEGEKNTVNEVFERIKIDPRHQHVLKVVDTSIEQIIFQDYHFGFTIVDNKQAIKNLHNYLEWLRGAENKFANQIIVMVENFINVSQ
ncbi:BLUF domain-containing protein [Algibacter sp. L4_22]|uniref:BLUF domain-containing protein n=1 Tax=Algibacter sp. L4_22 TaxID=2942477 RepID=UPI00201B9640|nr:BLUF domain-containing protein [Algibacter sp. L4_22]MCL5130053.1 BLUF domain-containing protein [Algibacter sp. L4_22]